MNNSLIPSTEEMKTIETMAKYATDSNFFQKMGGPGGVLSIMLYARELGLNPMQCLFGGMNNIQGKIELSSRLINSLIRRAGHKLQTIKLTNTECRIKGTRHDTGETDEAVFTIDDAKIAGIYKEGGGWTKYPQDMLFARCISRLGRRLFADVIGTAYVEGEIEDAEIKTIRLKEIKEEPEEEFCVVPEPEFTVENATDALKDIVITNIQKENLSKYLQYIQEKTRYGYKTITDKFLNGNIPDFLSKFDKWLEKQSGQETANIVG